MYALPRTTDLPLRAHVIALLMTLAAAAAHAQTLVAESRAIAPARSCMQQMRADGIRDPQARRVALDQCLRARMAERTAQPAPVRPQGTTP